MALTEALDGKRELTWELWASPIADSVYLAADGRRVAGWAVEVLRAFLGDGFLQRVREAEAMHALLSPGLLTTLWPIVDSPRLYEDLFRLAALIALTDPRSKGRRDLQRTMTTNFDPTSWAHCLIQLELAGLARRDGWSAGFELPLGNGNRGDVWLEKGTEALAIEVTSVGMSASQQAAGAFFHQASMRILSIEVQHNAYASGAIGDVVPQEALDRWLADVEAAAQATAVDGQERYVPGPAEAAVWVAPERFRPNETHLEGPTGATDIWGRLRGRVFAKGRKTIGTGTTWLRLQEHEGLWEVMIAERMSLAERLAAVAPHLQAMLEPHPHLAGIVLTPGPMWAAGGQTDETVTLDDMPGAIALRRPFGFGRIRESIIVTRSGNLEQAAQVFAELYGQEDSWLDWALAALGHPPLTALLQINMAPSS